MKHYRVRDARAGTVFGHADTNSRESAFVLAAIRAGNSGRAQELVDLWDDAAGEIWRIRVSMSSHEVRRIR